MVTVAGLRIVVDFGDVPSIVVPLDGSTGLPTHAHPQHQLTWAVDGVLTMEASDRRWVVQRSRALWVPGGVPHAVAPGSADRMMSLYFEPAESPLGWEDPTVVDATGLTGPLLEYLVGLEPSANDRRAHALAVLWDLIAPVAVTTLPTILPDDAQARAVALAIRARPADGRSLAQWGRDVGASARTLSRRFRSETGVSFESWRSFERLNAALPLLADGLPVSRVARQVGYVTPSAFIAAFRRELGTTPAAYFGAARTGAAADRPPVSDTRDRLS